MSKVKSASASKPANQLKELKKRNEELTDTVSLLTRQNEEMREKLRTITRKIFETCGMNKSTTPPAELLDEGARMPEDVDTADMIKMIEQLYALATQISQTDKIESHMEALEFRITELSKENSIYFKSKLQLQERLEFVMLERDGWKRNATNLRNMLNELVKNQKCVKDQTSEQNCKHCIIGSYQANMDPHHLTKRVFSATIPKTFNSAAAAAAAILTDASNKARTINLSVENLLDASANNNNNNNNNNNAYASSSNLAMFKNETLSFQAPSATTTRYAGHLVDSSKSSFSDMYDRAALMNPLLDAECGLSLNGTSGGTIGGGGGGGAGGAGAGGTNNSSGSMSSMNSNSKMSKKNVSFSQNILVYQKRSKKSNELEPFVLPFSPVQSQEDSPPSPIAGPATTTTTTSTASTSLATTSISPPSSASSTSTLVATNTPATTPTEQQQQQQQQLGNEYQHLQQRHHHQQQQQQQQPQYNTWGENHRESSFEQNRFAERANICSSRKLSGQTLVKDMEPTLKMIVIKELSEAKANGNDWRQFARLIGISESDIESWTVLRLQFPMARVLSVWSSRPDATTRSLYAHLSSPPLDYVSLAKRIENFYNVL